MVGDRWIAARPWLSLTAERVDHGDQSAGVTSKFETTLAQSTRGI